MGKAFSKVVTRMTICAGVLLLLAAGAVLIYGLADDYYAGQRAQNLLEQVHNNGWEQPVHSGPAPRISLSTRYASALAHENDSPDAEETDAELADNAVIGILEIPKLNKSLPILNKSTYAMLDISVCRYTGSIDSKPNRLVISGHNYRSHFGELTTLEIGDEILITTVDGQTFRYSVISFEVCHMYDPDAVQEGDDWDVTLLTCRKNRAMRTLVRLKEIAD